MKSYFICLVLVFSWGSMPAQEEVPFWQEEENLLINANFTLGLPLSHFKDNINAIGFGGGGALLFLLKNADIPIYVGFEMNGVTYDRLSDRFSLLLDGFWTNVELETKTNILAGNGILQIAPWPYWPVQPYFQGVFGVKNLFTQTELIELDSGFEESIDRNIEAGDWALNYGGSLGLAIPIPLYEYVGFKLDVKCSYIKGAAADYFVRRTDNAGQSYTEPIDAFEEKNSHTDMLYPQIGVQFILGKLRKEAEKDLE